MDEQKAEEIKKHIALNSARLVPKFIKLYYKMDGRCRQLCNSNPSRLIEDYCPKCQEMFAEVLKGEIK